MSVECCVAARKASKVLKHDFCISEPIPELAEDLEFQEHRRWSEGGDSVLQEHLSRYQISSSRTSDSVVPPPTIDSERQVEKSSSSSDDLLAEQYKQQAEALEQLRWLAVEQPTSDSSGASPTARSGPAGMPPALRHNSVLDSMVEEPRVAPRLDDRSRKVEMKQPEGKRDSIRPEIKEESRWSKASYCGQEHLRKI